MGYIFPAETYLLISFENQKERFTPDESDIHYLESVLRDKLKKVNKPRINQGKGCPVIHKKLKKYMRQYVGYVTHEGERIIWVNFIWSEGSMESRLSKGIISVHDGCSRYWRIKVNLDTGELFDLDINGTG
jgi:hypothetical protein